MPQVGEGVMLGLLGAKNYGFAHAYVFHDGNVESDGRVDYLPIYMVGCLRG